jgi:hypothetical protein
MAITGPALNVTEAPAAKRGFGELPCPCCGAEGCITLDLSDLDTLFCPNCEAAFDLAAVKSFIAKWQRLLTWVESAPAAE